MNEWEYKQALEDGKKLQDAGYKFTYDRFGYRVDYKDEFVSAAGVMGRPKMHWQHARQNVRDNFQTCVYEAKRHAEKNGIKWGRES